MSSGISPKKEYSGKAVDQSIDNLKPLEDYFEKKPNLNNEQKHAASSQKKIYLYLLVLVAERRKQLLLVQSI